MGLRRQSRELALQFLFSLDMQGRLAAPLDEMKAAFSSFSEHFTSTRAALPYARSLVEGVCQHWQELDQNIAAHSHNWRIERMSTVDRTILRIAAYELTHRPDVPYRVVINEAIDSTKRFGSEHGHTYVNGVLDKAAAALRSTESQAARTR